MSGVNRTKAIRKTRIAQVAGLALVALVAGAVMYSPGLPEAPAQPTGFGDPMTDESTQERSSNANLQQEDVNPEIIGGNFDKTNNIVPKPIDPKPTTSEPDPVGGTTAIATNDDWKYLGGVFEPNFSFALVEIDGKQRMLRKGTRLEAYDAEVVAVSRDEIEISKGGVIERISLSDSTGQIVSVANQPEQGAAATVAMPGRDAGRNYLSDIENQAENQADVDKRRAEFERRMKEREERLRGNNR
ncbi:MAG: hypothetical protein Phyf2KO_22150 [Phycisphaerales bacterium]